MWSMKVFSMRWPWWMYFENNCPGYRVGRWLDLRWGHLGSFYNRIIEGASWGIGERRMVGMLIWGWTHGGCVERLEHSADLLHNVLCHITSIILHSSLNFAYVYLLPLLIYTSLHAFILKVSDTQFYQGWTHGCIDSQQGESCFPHGLSITTPPPTANTSRDDLNNL